MLKIEMERTDPEQFNGEALNVIAGAFDGGSCAYEHHVVTFNIRMMHDGDDWPSQAEVHEAVCSVGDMTNLFFQYHEGCVTMHYDIRGRGIASVVWSIGHYLKLHCPHEPIVALEIDMAAGASYFHADREAKVWRRDTDRFDV